MALTPIQLADIAKSAFGHFGAGETGIGKIAGEIIKKAQRLDPTAYSDFGDQNRVIAAVRGAKRALDAGEALQAGPPTGTGDGLPIDPTGAAYSEAYLYRVRIDITNPDTLETFRGGLVVIRSNQQLTEAEVIAEALDADQSGDWTRIQSGYKGPRVPAMVVEPTIVTAGRTR